MVKNKAIRFQLPSSRNYFCEMTKTSSGYELIFFQSSTKLKTVIISERQLDRHYLHKTAVGIGIEFYALTGPYDCADEILRQWHKNFENKGFLQRIFGKQ